MLDALTLRVIAKDAHFLVVNKGADERLDGDFEVTIEKALYRDFPDVKKFRWIHQLDFALACKLFREKRVQKEYLAVVRGHLPFDPSEHIAQLQAAAAAASKDNVASRGSIPTQCTLSKLGWLIQDTEEIERLKTQHKGSQAHQRDPAYPRGVRHGPSLYHMEQLQLIRERDEKGRELTEEERKVIETRWRDLAPETQEPYKARGKRDRERFMQEIEAFLDTEKDKLRKKRRYDTLGTVESADNEDKAPSEPVGYVFEDPIAEPDGDLFRMQIGTPAVPGKASSTIAFVLGHATYNGEPVTKVLLRPLTGRRHQLRLHLSHHGFPILGDVTYGDPDDDAQRMMLHAWKLWFMAPQEAKTKYGDLYFASPDPFEAIVPNKREVTTITYQRQQQQQKDA
uniref:Pseudouridine synthase RsuA/RluA-like domain-containing protein n=1 Tax=Globisporangium ultimum (strain ATCC 200006 / CBS 805.95 / DAOM BR144) TaxID=431595 RepID=K3W5Q3_GLOUD